jgi:hypothetical protein
MNKPDWNDLIARAVVAGFKVEYSEELDGWELITPARPRHPSQALGVYPDSRTAWHDAVLLASQLE